MTKKLKGHKLDVVKNGWNMGKKITLGLEKQRQIKKSINKLIDENNEIMTDQMHILSTIKSYYENCILQNILMKI